jgi:hypothetical protein
LRVISQYTNAVAQIRPQRQRSLGDGSIEITQEPIYARFKSLQDGAFLFENEEALAERHFNFHGNTQDVGQAIPTDPLVRLSVYDTDEAAQEADWDEETKDFVEERLERFALEDPATFLIVTSTPIAKPYPAYDTDDRSPQELVVKLIEDGHDVEVVLHYERMFGAKRPEVISMLEEAVEMKKELVIPA